MHNKYVSCIVMKNRNKKTKKITPCPRNAEALRLRVCSCPSLHSNDRPQEISTPTVATKDSINQKFLDILPLMFETVTEIINVSVVCRFFLCFVFDCLHQLT